MSHLSLPRLRNSIYVTIIILHRKEKTAWTSELHVQASECSARRSASGETRPRLKLSCGNRLEGPDNKSCDWDV
jgi:hypothetical protein